MLVTESLFFRCDISQVDVADLCFLVPGLHRINGLTKLRVLLFVDPTCADPTVVQL